MKHARTVLAGVATLVLAVCAMAGCGNGENAAGGRSGTITILTWESYHDPEWLKAYEEKTDVRVDAVVAGSVDEMYAKVSSGAVRPDVIYLDTGSIPRYANRKLISPLDASKLGNAGNVAAGLEWEKVNAYKGKLYGVPYSWGTLPLAYDTKAMPKPSSWSVLWDPKYRGKVILQDDAYATIPMVAMYVGAKDPYNLTEAEFGKVEQALRKLRPQVATVARGYDDATQLFASGQAVTGHLQNVAITNDLRKQGKPFGYTFPDEGTPAYIDNAVLTPQGQRKEVYDFIDEGLSLAWQKRFIEASTNNGALSADKAAEAGVDKGVMKQTNIADQERDGFWDGIAVMQYPEDIERRVQLFTEFKAGV